MARARTSPKPRATAKQRDKRAAGATRATRIPATRRRAKPAAAKPAAAKPAAAKPAAAKPAAAKPATAKPAAAKSAAAKSAAAKSAAAKPAAATRTAKLTAATRTTSKPTLAGSTAATRTTSRPAATESAASRRTSATESAASRRTTAKPAATSRTGKPAARSAAATRTLVARAAPTWTAGNRAEPAARRTDATQTATDRTRQAVTPRGGRPARKPPARLRGGSAVVKLLEAKQPIEALRKFLARIPGEATREQGQIALGSAQLMLLPIAHEHRGGEEVRQLLDLVLSRWHTLPDRSGFHAQEFLRNAFAAVGDDRDRIARLAALVPPDATSELRFNMAGAYAAAGDRTAMLGALEAALAAGATAAQVLRDPDLARFAGDPEVVALIERTAAPAIPVDVAPHVAPVRAALDSLIGTLRKLGGPSRLNPPASLDAVLATERASRIQLPNDYRALLTISDGAALWDHELFGTRDLRGDTHLAHRAREFLTAPASSEIGMDACVPLARWGRPDHWLLYDPRGVVREGAPGYLMLAAELRPLADLADALGKLEDSVRDALATN